MLVRTVAAIRGRGWQTLVTVPGSGPLLERLHATGTPVLIVPTPVLRKSMLSFGGLLHAAMTGPRDVVRLVQRLRSLRPDIVYVNTMTLPHWILAARAAGVPVVCHVRELESQVRPMLASGLVAPLLLATRVIANSHATSAFLGSRQPSLASRVDVVHNGFDFPDPPPPRGPGGAERVVLVGRLSPRKGQDLAIRAVAALAKDGREVELVLVGSVFPGYEWFERELRALTEELGIRGQVRFCGYLDDVWPALAAADAVVVPSRLEPFGSVAVEALAAARPVVVSDVGGLPEIADGEAAATVVPSDDVRALTVALAAGLDLGQSSPQTLSASSSNIRRRFGRTRYEQQVLAILTQAVGRAL